MHYNRAGRPVPRKTRRSARRCGEDLLSPGSVVYNAVGLNPGDAMIQCTDCEFFQRGPNGEVAFGCDPFSTIKEPECLNKWQLIKINQMVASYQATLKYYEKFAPMQEKMFKMMEREIDEVEEADSWKYDDQEDELDVDLDDEHDDDWRDSV
jgi:hypothetical protein